jgi:tRNA A-37 threonylcarbamoyl transferase component Bud32
MYGVDTSRHIIIMGTMITNFDFQPGRILVNKYEIIAMLGSGWEGEVYKVRERTIGIERAVKFFYPERNIHNRAIKFYAKKLHKLNHCPIVIQYLTQEHMIFRKVPITFLVSEYVEGELLSTFLKKQKARRLHAFEGLHLLHALAVGVEEIHRVKEYHGDLHDDNIIIKRSGLSFSVKLVDMFNWGAPSARNIRDDVCDLVRIFYDAIGGARFYTRQRDEIKDICCGLKRSLITRKFRTAGHLRHYLEAMAWHDEQY